MTESITCDVVIVGAGPAGLSAAITLKQHHPNLEVLVLEKGSEVGAHTLSGAVLDPRALLELLPNKANHFLQSSTPVSKESFWLLTAQKHLSLPVPSSISNQGFFIVRLGHLVKQLAEEASHLGVDIYAGFAAQSCLFDSEKRVIGVQTGAFGLNADGSPSDQHQPSMAIYAKYTLLAEGARGSITQSLIRDFSLQGSCPQTYGIGIKELWELPENVSSFQPGTVLHTVGWPLDSKTYGGSFLYTLAPRLISVGLVVGLDYANPYIDPFKEMQRFKTHPSIQPFLTGGQRIAYGARVLNEGGWQAIPQLILPGALIIGCAAGFMNVPKIKGTHTAMKSGMLAGESVAAALQKGLAHQAITAYPEKIQRSWIKTELMGARNIRPAFRYGLWVGLVNAALELFVFKGKMPWTWTWTLPDHAHLKPAQAYSPPHYPAPDGQLTFDKMGSVYLSNTGHRENEPCHLKIQDPTLPLQVNWPIYRGPESRYCPADVYEFLGDENAKTFRINPQNCIHCKTCDIKDPNQNIQWVPPEGGGGPQYPEL